MCHKLIVCQDIAVALHGILSDDWFFSYTDEIVTDAVHKLELGKLASATAVANAILKAHPFTQWDDADTNGYRSLFNDLCDVIDPILNDYAKFCARQMVLEPILSARKRRAPRKTLAVSADQRKAMDQYLATIARVAALKSRVFPANVVDLVHYRAMRS